MGNKIKILTGDARYRLSAMEDNSVDAIITDPPYELGFMGKKWDNSGVAYDVRLWKEALRVLKPGGFLLAFGGTRTYHRLACAIEDAGFEIRDCIQWLYGSGFPKSLNIGKQIDKIQGNERKEIEPTGRYKYQFKDNVGKIVNTRDVDDNSKTNFKLTKGNSEWEGWGTALKPANEPIVVARKPLSEKNVALNVLKWGTGGINIDACRIEHNENTGRKGYDADEIYKFGMKNKGSINEDWKQGRFPANIILDEEAGRLLDLQSGILKGEIGRVGRKDAGNYDATSFKVGVVTKTGIKDIGGASRFFYCAKASKSERNFGCEEFEEKTKSHLTSQNFENALTGSGNIRKIIHKNNHPTVKPIKLMEYLIKLVSREGAVVLDPFLGSGTTGCACVNLNRNFIGIEKEEEYVKIAEARIKAYQDKKEKENVQENLNL